MAWPANKYLPQALTRTIAGTKVVSYLEALAREAERGGRLGGGASVTCRRTARTRPRGTNVVLYEPDFGRLRACLRLPQHPFRDIQSQNVFCVLTEPERVEPCATANLDNIAADQDRSALSKDLPCELAGSIGIGIVHVGPKVVRQQRCPNSLVKSS